MNGAFYVAATGLRAEERAVEVTANNVANWNTPRFKRTRVQFGDLAAPVAANPLTFGVTAPPMGVRVRTAPTAIDAGALRQTDAPADLAIDGAGFIEVLGPDGQTLLWRGGRLKVDADGWLATDEGHVLRAMIAAPRDLTGLAIDRQGVVSALRGGNAESLGRIDLVTVRDPAAIEPLGAGIFRATRDDALRDASSGDDDAGAFAQGFEEASNVRLSDEMVFLVIAQRAYAANAQAVQAADQLMAIANGLRR